MTSERQSGLRGKRVLVTRACTPEQSENELSKKLKAFGAVVTEKPLLSISAPSSYDDLDCALKHLDRFDWIVFASQRAVASVLSRLHELSKSVEFQNNSSFFKNRKIAVVGKSTADYLKDQGIEVDFYPNNYCAEALVNQFPGENLDGINIFWPRTLAGETTIHDGLQARGARVTMAEAYSSNVPEASDHLALELNKLMQAEIDIVTFTSSQTVRNFVSMLKPETSAKKLSELYPNVIVAVIGPKTAQTALEYYGRADVVAGEYTIEGLLMSLERFFEHS